MSLRRFLAATLLLVAAGTPQALALGVHALAHYEHGEDRAGDTEEGRLAEALFHGHEHAAGDPGHEHRFLTSPSLRPDPRLDYPVAEVAFLNDAPAGPSWSLDAGPRGDTFRLPGSSPPPLLLLCTLLI